MGLESQENVHTMQGISSRRQDNFLLWKGAQLCQIQQASTPRGFNPNLKGPVPRSEWSELSLTFLHDWLAQRGMVSRAK